jgi:hypothetical protein
MTVTVAYMIVPGFPGYRVGDDGTVWSRLKMGCRGQQQFTDKWRKMSPVSRRGYFHVFLSNPDRKQRKLFVHQLVLLSFVGPCPPGMECCHNDGKPGNNALRNLRWDTRKGNTADKRRHGTARQSTNTPGVKLNELQVSEIRRRLSAGETHTALARQFGVNRSTVSLIAVGRTWRFVAAPTLTAEALPPSDSRDAT